MKRKGFTLVELLAVIGIISIIGTMATFQVASSLANARESSCYNRMQLLVMAEARFYAAEGRHSAELLSGTPITASSEVVKKHYYLWQQDTCTGDYYWTLNGDGDYELRCTVHEDSVVVLERSKLRSDMLTARIDQNDCINWGFQINEDVNDFTVPTGYYIPMDALEEDIGYIIVDKNNYIFGSENNEIELGNEKHIIDAGAGNDYIKTGNGKDIVLGGDGHDLMVGENAKDTFYGGYGCDYMIGNNGSDTFMGGPGNDYFNGGLAPDTAIYEYPIAEYTMTKENANTYKIRHIGSDGLGGVEGVDTLVDVDLLEFADRDATSIETIYEEIRTD